MVGFSLERRPRSHPQFARLKLPASESSQLSLIQMMASANGSYGRSGAEPPTIQKRAWTKPAGFAHIVRLLTMRELARLIRPSRSAGSQVVPQPLRKESCKGGAQPCIRSNYITQFRT